MAPYQKTNACGLPSRSARHKVRLRPSGYGATAIAALRARRLVGLGRLELPTSRLSSARSNQLSYKPLTRGTCHARARRLDAGCIAQAQPWRVFVREERETKTAKSRQCSSTILTTVGH